jgi:hypothetical protein
VKMPALIALATLVSLLAAGAPAGAQHQQPGAGARPTPGIIGPPTAGAGVAPGSVGHPPAGAGLIPGTPGIPSAGAGVRPEVGSGVRPPPLPPFVPAAPHYVWVWMPGYWSWDGYQWLWVPGYWTWTTYWR